MILLFTGRLQVVSTRVGGIPEVLPPELIYLTEPDVPCKLMNTTKKNKKLLLNCCIICCFLETAALMEGLEKAMKDLNDGRAVPPYECHRKVSSLYNWTDVTQRTEVVYDIVAKDKSKALGLLLQWSVSLRDNLSICPS